MTDPSPRRRTRPIPSPELLARAGRTVGWALVAGLLVVLVARASSLVAAIHSNADLAAPLAMADLLDDLPGSAAMTGNYGWWNGLWAAQALHQLPGGTLTASYLPLALTVAAIAVLTVQAGRLYGGRAAMAVPLVAGAVASSTWLLHGAWSGRGPSWWGMVALGVLLVARAGPQPLPARVVVLHRILLAAVVVWCAAALSGDALAWTSIVAPGLAVGGAAIVTRRPRAAVLPIASAAAIAVLSVAIRWLAEDRGYLQRPSPVELVDFEEAQPGTGNLVLGLEAVWRGPDGSSAGAAAGYLGALLVAVAVGAGVVLLIAVLTRTWAPGDAPSTSSTDGTTDPVDERPTGDDGGARDDDPAGSDGDHGAAAASSGPTDDVTHPARVAWVTYWTAVLAAALVAFVFSGASFVDGQPVARYLFGVPFAAGALLAAQAGRMRFAAPVLAPAALLAALAILGLARTEPPRMREARTTDLPAIEAVARAERVTRGYASYWSSYPMSVRSAFRLQVDPVGECPAPQGTGLCPMFLHYVDRAYEPRPGIRSFLLVDDGPGSVAGPGVWVTRPPDGPTPVAVHQIGPNLRMLIYDHDLAADLQDHTVLGDPLRHRD